MLLVCSHLETQTVQIRMTVNNRARKNVPYTVTSSLTNGTRDFYHTSHGIQLNGLHQYCCKLSISKTGKLMPVPSLQGAYLISKEQCEGLEL